MVYLLKRIHNDRAIWYIAKINCLINERHSLMILKLFPYIMLIIYLLQLIKANILHEMHSRKSKLYIILCA